MHVSSRPTTAIHWLHTFYLQLVRLAIRHPDPIDGTILPVTEVPPDKFFRRRSDYGMTSNLVLSNSVWVHSEVDCEAMEADVGAEPRQVCPTLHVDNRYETYRAQSVQTITPGVNGAPIDTYCKDSQLTACGPGTEMLGGHCDGDSIPDLV